MGGVPVQWTGPGPSFLFNSCLNDTPGGGELSFTRTRGLGFVIWKDGVGWLDLHQTSFWRFWGGGYFTDVRDLRANLRLHTASQLNLECCWVPSQHLFSSSGTLFQAE